jgi:hypothetical protein
VTGPYTERAQRVQDDIGWADSTNAMEMGQVTLHLAQLVTDLAREIDRINAEKVSVD